ncbi:MaoC family dehydratase [Rhizobium sp. PAMB 3174]
MTARYYFEDFHSGRTFPFAPVTVSKEEIIAFASEFDPQPMHTDEEAAKESMFGTLVASGWHTSSIMMRMMIDAYLLQSASEGSPGVDLMEWKKPVLAGDTLSGQTTVVQSRGSASRPGLGLVKVLHELFNQRGELVLKSENWIMMRRRPAEEAQQ